MTGEAKSSQTLTVGQLIDVLSKLDPDLPVVMSQEDEPLGHYGVRSVEVYDMQRENTHAGGRYGIDVFHNQISHFPVKWWIGDNYENPGTVVLLGSTK
jgi:hypothetical protein